MKQNCLTAGTPADQCASLAQGALDECLANCGATPPTTCTEACEPPAEDKYEKVLERTNNEKKATKKGQRVFRTCAKDCPTTTLPDSTTTTTLVSDVTTTTTSTLPENH